MRDESPVAAVHRVLAARFGVLEPGAVDVMMLIDAVREASPPPQEMTLASLRAILRALTPHDGLETWAHRCAREITDMLVKGDREVEGYWCSIEGVLAAMLLRVTCGRDLAPAPADPRTTDRGWVDDPFKRLDAIGLDRDHPTHAVAREAIEAKIAEAEKVVRNPPLEEVADHLDDLAVAVAEKTGKVGIQRLVVSADLGLSLGLTSAGPVTVMTACGPVQVVVDRDAETSSDDRELIRKLDAGVGRICDALGIAPGGADFDGMVDAIKRLRANQAPTELTKGLLDALVLTPMASARLSELVAGEGGSPEIGYVNVTVQGLPGIRVVVQAAAFRELQVALEMLLGAPAPGAR